MRYESAELAKIAINHFLAASVAMTNTLAELCEAIGADWAEIEPALRLDRRIGPHAYLTPGLGIAGGNIERDLATVTRLAEQHATDAGIVRAIVANSRHRCDWALRQVQQAVAMRAGRQTAAVWGLAYKPGTASLRNSPSLALLDALTGADIRAYDPAARLNGFRPHVTVVGSAIDACRDADVLVVMTPWDEFGRIDVVQIRDAMRGRVIVDPFGALNAERCVTEGFAYSRLGRPHE
jgi:UDPglucose 6-dehydrogenase